MCEKLSLRVTNKLVKLKIINIKDFDVYKYGFELLISLVSTIAIIIVISAIVGKFGKTVIYLTGFFCVRAICGGFHAKHHYSCFIITILTYIIFLLLDSLLYIVPNIRIFLGALVLLSFISIICLAPVEHPNNPMTMYRKRKSKVLSVAFSIVLLLIFAAAFKLNALTKIFSSFFIGVFIASVSIIVAEIEKSFLIRKEVQQ